jgi:DNA-binding beta-propeller fold protein YncE
VVDGSGNVYVADTNNGRIEKFDPNGTFLAKWGSYGSSDGQFNSPAGVAVDSSGNVYVADQNNNRIVKLSPAMQVQAVWR